MKKALALLLVLCLIVTALPLCVGAVSSNLSITANIEREIYYPGDTFTLTLNLSNNADGFSSLRGKLIYDSKNITLSGFKCNTDKDTENGSTLSASYSKQGGYIQIMWTAGSGLVNYSLDGVIAELKFTVNKKADNKTYNFYFEYLDGTRYVYGEDFKETDWVYVENVETKNDSFIVDTTIDSTLYFKDAPTGAYLNEDVSLDIAFSGEIGLYIFKAKLNYDKTSFEFKGCQSKNSSLNFDYTLKDGYLILLFDSNNTQNFNEEGVIATVTFGVKENATLSNATFGLEYVDAVTINLSNGVSIEKPYFNTISCQFPILSERVPVTATFYRGNGDVTTLTLYKDEKLVLPDTNFVDKKWYKNKGASVDSIYTDTICPAEDFTLYSSACAVDNNDPLVALRYNQQFNIVKENEKEVLSYSSGEESNTARMFRLDKLTDNTTYKLTVTYKANIENSLGFNIVGATGDNMYVDYSCFEGYLNTSIYEIVPTSDYKTVDIFFTASIKGTVAEQSAGDDIKDVKGNGWAYLVIIDENQSDNDSILIRDLEITEIKNALNIGGASLLTDEGYAAAENTQAIRYYFSYTTSKDEDGAKIRLGNKFYTIAKRGFLYRNGATDKYADENSVTKEGMNITAAENNSDIIVKSKSTELNKCYLYDYDTNNLCFSTYVSKYTKEMYSLKLMVRGFVTLIDEEGNEFTIYSAPINRSVSGMMANSVSSINAI